MKSLEETYIPHLKKILEAVETAEEKTDGYYLETTMERPDISYELLKVLYLSDELVELFNTTKQVGEYLGLPKLAVAGAEESLEIINDRGIDFTSWFSEKTTSIKAGAKKAIRYWEMDVVELELSEDAPFSSEDYIFKGLSSGLTEAKVYAETIHDMIMQESKLGLV